MPPALFVTRKFPPSVGGMERLAADLWAGMRSEAPDDVRLLAHGGGIAGLPWFTVRAAWWTWRAGRTRGGAWTLVTGDVLMTILLWPVLRLRGTRRRPRVAVFAHGKDVLWSPRPYQRVVRHVLPRADLVVANSAATAAAVRAVGVEDARLRVLRLGVEVPPAPDRAASRAALRGRLGVPAGAVVLVAVGRQVRRKGAAWFVREVMPRLGADVHLAIAGDGPDADAVAAAVAASPAAARIHVLGRVDDDVRELLMAGGDVFVQPNVPVAGDMEGFGLVAVEAAMRGAVVVAAELEGLRDAVVPGETGLLLPPGDADAWVAALDELLAAPAELAALADRFATVARDVYSRERMGRDAVRLLGLR